MLRPALESMKQPVSSDYSRAQRQRLLNAMLGWTLLAALIAAAVSVGLRDMPGAGIMLLIAAGCVVGLMLNRADRSDSAALLLCVGIFVGITLQARLGAGTHDVGVVVYPVLILEATFLFGNRWGRLAATAACIGAVVWLWEAQTRGLIADAPPATFGRIIAIVAVLLATAGITQVVRATWDDNLASLIDSYDKTLRGWALALESRDGETAGHCARVVPLAVALAEALGSSAEEVESIRRGAYLHDIGKMAIPDEILKKPGPLTPDERGVIERHPELGLAFVGDVPFLAPAAQVMYAHHECWDGTGYPRGLKGEEIPLGARVFSLADQWDALMSDRPYRAAWSQEEAIAYVRDNTGTVFDPHVAEVFLAQVVGPGDAGIA